MIKIAIVNFYPPYSALSIYSDKIFDYFSKKNFLIEKVNFYKKRNFFTKFLALNFLKINKKYDILIGVSADLSKILFKSNSRKKIIIHHDLYKIKKKKFIYNLVFKYLYSFIEKIDEVICISKFAKNELIDVCPNQKNTHVIYGGIDDVFLNSKIKKAPPKKKEEIVFIHVGRCDSRKNFLFVLKLISKFFSKNKLYKVGAVSKRESEFIKIKKLKVVFLKNLNTKELADYYQKSDFLLFPSLYEGFGLPIIEAMSQGCLPLSDNNTGLKESNLKKNTVDLKLNLWNKKINKTINDDDLENLINENYEYSQNFSWLNFNQKLENLIK